MILPELESPPITVNPSKLFIYAPPKLGKSTLLSKLKGCLILDLENGSDFLTALKLKVNSLVELAEVGKAIKDAGRPYKYIAIDTATKLEEWCEIKATENYKKSPLGKEFKGSTVLELPNGAGYLWLREAYKKAIDFIYTLADNIILVGHIKDKMITTKSGTEVSAKDIDLTGKIKTITTSNADAIAYLYRDKENKLWMSFKTTEEITCGSRCNHLKGRDIHIADPIYGEDDIVYDITAYWDRIYIN